MQIICWFTKNMLNHICMNEIKHLNKYKLTDVVLHFIIKLNQHNNITKLNYFFYKYITLSTKRCEQYLMELEKKDYKDLFNTIFVLKF